MTRVCVSCLEKSSRKYLAIFGCVEKAVHKTCKGCSRFNHCGERLSFDPIDATFGICQPCLDVALKKYVNTCRLCGHYSHIEHGYCHVENEPKEGNEEACLYFLDFEIVR